MSECVYLSPDQCNTSLAESHQFKPHTMAVISTALKALLIPKPYSSLNYTTHYCTWAVTESRVQIKSVHYTLHCHSAKLTVKVRVTLIWRFMENPNLSVGETE